MGDGIFVGVDFGDEPATTVVCAIRINADGSRTIVDTGRVENGRRYHTPHRRGGRRHYHAIEGHRMGRPIPY